MLSGNMGAPIQLLASDLLDPIIVKLFGTMMAGVDRFHVDSNLKEIHRHHGLPHERFGDRGFYLLALDLLVLPKDRHVEPFLGFLNETEIIDIQGIHWVCVPIRQNLIEALHLGHKFLEGHRGVGSKRGLELQRCPRDVRRREGFLHLKIEEVGLLDLSVSPGIPIHLDAQLLYPHSFLVERRKDFCNGKALRAMQTGHVNGLEFFVFRKAAG